MSRATTLPKLFESLTGIWKLERNLHSTNANEPSGKCHGEASFQPRPPSPVVGADGKLNLAEAELLYHEHGEFELPNAIRLPFSKKYIWRLEKDSKDISVWFAKPGTEAVDYLFHKIGIPHDNATEQIDPEQKQYRQLHGSGGHLCIDDFYSTSYTFTFDETDLKIVDWESLHELALGYSCQAPFDGECRNEVAAEKNFMAFTIDSDSKIPVLLQSLTMTHPIMDEVKLPEPFASLPRHPLTFGPSPIHSLPRISAALGNKVPIYAKRDDCNSGLAYGGNKTRKLEYLIPDALAQNCTHLISIGGAQSNHTRQVAAAAASVGLKATLIQEHWVDHDDPGNERIGNIQLSRLMNADVRLDPSTFGIQHKDTLRKVRDEIGASGGKPYYIPAGASDHPLGGLGFARWSFEVRQQEIQMGVFFDTVIVCAVTGSTFAGMIAGFKLLEKTRQSPKRKVIGIDASAKPDETFAQVLRIAKSTASKIGLSESDITEDDVILDTRYHAGTYGIANEATIEAIKFGARTEAFITDPVYEGKSLAGMMDMIKTGEIEVGSTVLYAHLGGQLALNAYSEIQ